MRSTGLRGHVIAALGADGRTTEATNDTGEFAFSLAAVAGATWHFNPTFGVLLQAGGQAQLGGHGAHALTTGLGVSIILSDNLMRIAAGPAYAFTSAVSAPGLSVTLDLLRALRGPLVVGFSTGYLQFTAAGRFQQEVRLGISVGYGI